MAATKDTIYIEADDEITTVIEKIIGAKSAIIAVVLPKRATVFQSVVNMKLLKKAATETKHKIVLITSDTAIESIAAIAGLHIAQSLSSKPFIPKRKSSSTSTETITPNELEPVTTNAPLTLAERDEASESAEEVGGNDTIEIDNTEQEAPAAIETVALDNEKKKTRFKIPDFGSFRLKMALAIMAVILLVSGWFVGFVVMPKAVVAINADTENRQVTLDLSVDATVEETDANAGVVSAELMELLKENKSTVEATGEKNTGEKATGTVTLTNCRKSDEGITVPAGTGFSAGSQTFVTAVTVELGPAVYVGNNCISDDFPAFGAIKDVAVVASQSGEAYNLAAQSFQSSVSGVTAYGSAMTGGTTNLIKVVSAADIQKAKDQLQGTATADATSELKAKHETEGRKAMVETLVQTEPILKSSKEVDAEASEVTVTQTVTYKMLGVASEDLAKVLDAAIEKTFVDGATKTIRSNGLDKTTYILKEKKAENKQVFTMQTVAVLGAIFDESAIKNEVVGKKRGDIEKLLESRDGVRSVSVEYSPFWVTTTPKKADKITVVVNEVSGE